MHELITAIAALLWPLIALTALLVFRRAIGRVLRTAERRELEVEIGGQRLTFHELNEQQNEMIQDLQRQLSIVSQKLDERERAEVEARGVTIPPPPEGADGNGHGQGPDHATAARRSRGDDDGTSTGGSAILAPPGGAAGAPPPARTPGPEQGDGEGVADSGEFTAVRAPSGPDPYAVLWVAERPEAHALLVEQLRDNGVRVTVTATTSEAVAELSERPYRLVVSDMSRKEDGSRVPDAGLVLLRELRDLGVDTPVILFGGQRGQPPYADQARRLGAVATTSSSYEMFRHFQTFGLL